MLFMGSHEARHGRSPRCKETFFRFLFFCEHSPSLLPNFTQLIGFLTEVRSRKLHIILNTSLNARPIRAVVDNYLCILRISLDVDLRPTCRGPCVIYAYRTI